MRDCTELGRELTLAWKEGDRLRDHIARLEAALERLANPMGEPKTEEAALLQIEVEQIAREALGR